VIECTLLLVLPLMMTPRMIYKSVVDTGVILRCSSYGGQCIYCLVSPSDRQVRAWVSSQCKHLHSINILTASVLLIRFFSEGIQLVASVEGKYGGLGGGLGCSESFKDFACILIEEFQLESNKRRWSCLQSGVLD